MLAPECNGQLVDAPQTLGHFALVSYIQDPLARFLDDLRLELTPGYKPHAHVTVLPPRPLHSDLSEAIHQLAENCRSVQPFRVELGEIQVFEASSVVYLGIRDGVRELRELYRLLNRGALQYKENFPYHPHITIAQNIVPEQAPRLSALAKEKWAGYQGPRGFLVSSLSLVQNVAPAIWADVVEVPIGLEVPVG